MARKVIRGLMVPLAAVSVQAAEFRVPLMKQAPTIDGNIDPVEWASAAGIDGFVQQTDLKLEPRRVKCFVGATETTIYVAIQSQLPDEGQLLTRTNADSLKAVYDDSLEVYVCPTPDSSDKVDYQFLANSRAKADTTSISAARPRKTPSWKGDYKQANGLHDGWWHFEFAIPLDRWARWRKAARPPTASGPSTHAQLETGLVLELPSSGGYATCRRELHLSPPSPRRAFATHGQAIPSSRPPTGRLTISNPATSRWNSKADPADVRNNMPEMKEEKALTLAPGQRHAEAGTRRKRSHTILRPDRAKVTSADGKTASTTNAQTKWARAKEANRWVTEQAQGTRRPLISASRTIRQRTRLRIAADINGLPKDAKPSNVTARSAAKADRKVIKTIDFPIDAVQGRPAGTDRRIAGAGGRIRNRAEGRRREHAQERGGPDFRAQEVPVGELPAGRSTKVYPPFTPIVVDGKEAFHRATRPHAQRCRPAGPGHRHVRQYRRSPSQSWPHRCATS